MAYVEINYRNFSNEELRKLIKIYTNIAYPVPEETVYLPVNQKRFCLYINKTVLIRHFDSSKTLSHSLDVK